MRGRGGGVLVAAAEEELLGVGVVGGFPEGRGEHGAVELWGGSGGG